MTRRAENPGTFPCRPASVPIRSGARAGIENATRQRKALKLMTPCQLETGKTVEQLDAEMAEQRARVRARLGLAA